MKKVSVIIPMYNAERWVTDGVLPDVCGQTYRNIQVIVINDGSGDNTKEVLEHKIEQEKQDIEYKVIHQENAGIANTRNRALEQADGEYILFLDQDDHIPEDYVQTYVDAIEQNGSDIVIGGYKTVDEEGKLIKEYHFDANDSWSKFKFITPWGRIYRRNFIEENQLKFLNYPIGEDIYFNLCAYSRTERIAFIDYTGYEWVQNSASFSHTVQRQARKTDVRPLFQAILDYVGEKKELETGYEYFFIKTAVYQILTTSRRERYEIAYNNWKNTFEWLKKVYDNYEKDLKRIEPSGEQRIVRMCVRFIVWLQHAGWSKAFLRIYVIL